MATLSREQVANLLHRAGFRGDAIWKLIAIAGRESSYNPDAHRTDVDPSLNKGDRGLFQINFVHDQRLKEAGIIRNASDLYDPLTNAKAAFYISSGGTSESALRQLWGADESGWIGGKGDYLYGTDPDAAKAAWQTARESGWTATGPTARPTVAAPAAPAFFNWQEHPELNDQYNSFSPHLQQFEDWVLRRFGGTDEGGYNERPIMGGTAPSSHAFGAAWDFQPDSDADKNRIIDLITKYPGAFGIQAIHDYKNSRVWRVGREGDLGGGWQSQPEGSHDGQMGHSTHLHFEVTPQAYSRDGRHSWRLMRMAVRGRFDTSRTGAAPVPPLPSETPEGRAASQRVTDLLKTYGVDYPDAPMPTPGLMAYLRGVGLSMDTAADIRRRTIETARTNKRAALEDIVRMGARSKEAVTGDLISRGILSSGEANTRYIRQTEDVQAQQEDVGRQFTGVVDAARTAYQQQLDALHTGILERTASTEETQDINEATSRATARGYNQANRQAQRQADREAAAREDQLNQLLGRYRRQNRWFRRFYGNPNAPATLPPRLRHPPAEPPIGSPRR